MQPPDQLRTERLLLRRWRPADAPALEPVLDANVAYLRAWIPWSVAEPASIPVLERRLTGYSDAFDAGREWLYGIFSPDEIDLFGGVGLYPRDESGRVPSSDATHVEIGYWLREDATGHGYVTEAAKAAASVAATFPHFSRIEIRCDPRNSRSMAVPARLGFRYCDPRTVSATEAVDPDSNTAVWELPLARITPFGGNPVVTGELI